MQKRCSQTARWTAFAVVAAMATSVAGCASQVDLSSIRREQRMLSRRLADQQADLDRLRNEVSRLRGHVDDSRYAGAPPSTPNPQDRYGQPGYPPAQSGQPGTLPPSSAPGGRDYATGTDYGTPGAPPDAGSGGFAAGAPPVDSQPAPGGGGGTNLQSDMGRGADSEYQQGLQSYARGDYQRSVQSLRNYVSRNPRDPLVPVAQYWIGEAYFSQGKYNESILAFNEILVTWPDSDRKPAALLRQADAFAKTGDKIDARMILQKLIEDHPGSSEAAEAKEQLRALGG